MLPPRQRSPRERCDVRFRARSQRYAEVAFCIHERDHQVRASRVYFVPCLRSHEHRTARRPR